MASDRFTRALNLIPWLGLILLCAVACTHGVRLTRNLIAPFDADAFRDVGIAQSFLDGAYPEDTGYAGGLQWYSPLVGAMVAVGSRLTGAAPVTVDARLGAYVNVLVPVAFFALCAAWVGPWAALAAVAFFILVISDNRFAQVNPTYSSWLFAPHFAQSLFYMTLLLYGRARKSARLRGHLAAGLLLGVTFIGHTAPAVLFGGILVLVTPIEALRALRESNRREARRTVLHALATLAVAFLVSLPYTWPVLWRYGYRPVNPCPARWIWPYLDIDNLHWFLRDFFTISWGLAYVGLVGILFHRGKRLEKTLLLSWLGLAAGFLAYSFVVQAANRRGIQLPMIVPGYHYLLYVYAVKPLLVGYAVLMLVGLIVDAVRALLFLIARRRFWATPSRARRCERLVTALLVAYFAYQFYFPYRTWFELSRDPAWFNEFAPAQDWVRGHGSPHDVFLCEDALSLFVVAPANRKVVCTECSYSNLYMDWERRDRDRTAMVQALGARDMPRFRELAARYNVSHVMLWDRNRKGLGVLSYPGFRLEFAQGAIAIYRIEP